MVNSVRTKVDAETGPTDVKVPMMSLNNTFSKTYLQSYIHLRDTEDTDSFFQTRKVNHKRSKT